jgi:peptidyl-tRNA hydrolase
MRAGVGPLPEWAVADEVKIPNFVLGRFEQDEQEIVEDMISRGAAALETILKKGLDLAISKYNRTYPTPE